MPISLEFWERGCPKRGDAHITVTGGLSRFKSVPCFPSLSVYCFIAARSSLIAYQIDCGDKTDHQKLLFYVYFYPLKLSPKSLQDKRYCFVMNSIHSLSFSSIQSRDDNVQRLYFFHYPLFLRWDSWNSQYFIWN